MLGISTGSPVFIKINEIHWSIVQFGDGDSITIFGMTVIPNAKHDKAQHDHWLNWTVKLQQKQYGWTNKWSKSNVPLQHLWSPGDIISHNIKQTTAWVPSVKTLNSLQILTRILLGTLWIAKEHTYQVDNQRLIRLQRFPGRSKHP